MASDGVLLVQRAKLPVLSPESHEKMKQNTHVEGQEPSLLLAVGQEPLVASCCEHSDSIRVCVSTMHCSIDRRGSSLTLPIKGRSVSESACDAGPWLLNLRRFPNHTKTVRQRNIKKTFNHIFVKRCLCLCALFCADLCCKHHRSYVVTMVCSDFFRHLLHRETPGETQN